KQYKRNHQRWDVADADMPVFGTIASQFGDPGTDTLYRRLMDAIADKTGAPLRTSVKASVEPAAKRFVIPPERVRYLAEIVEASEPYDASVARQCALARTLDQLRGTVELLRANVGRTTIELVDTGDDAVVQAVQQVEGEPEYLQDLVRRYQELEGRLDHG